MTNLIRRGSSSVKKELPKLIKFKRARRKSHFKSATVDALSRKINREPRIKGSGTVAVRHSPNGTQCSGQIQFTKGTRRNFTPTFDANGRYVHVVSSKIKVTPSDQWKGNGRAIKQRVKFTREQRISVAKAKAHYVRSVKTTKAMLGVA